MLKTMKFVFNGIENSSNDIYELCKGKDLVIVSHSQMGATEAEALNIKTVNVTLQPEMIPEKRRKKTLKDKFFSLFISPQMVKPYNRIRKRYGLASVKSMDQIMSPLLNLIPISPYVNPPNQYWEDINQMVGYWFQSEENYEPSEELQTFLSSGSKPILLALGAMSFESKEEKEKLDIFVNAFQKAGKRAMIQGFTKSLSTYELPETMLSIDSIPHSWLFKQGYCVIHHCGFGTSAASMIYGIPSIPVPHVLDQFASAECISRLNVGVPPIKATELSTERLVAAIQEVDVRYEELYQCVNDLSKKLQEERGLETAVGLIQEVMNNAPIIRPKMQYRR